MCVSRYNVSSYRPNLGGCIVNTCVTCQVFFLTWWCGVNVANQEQPSVCSQRVHVKCEVLLSFRVQCHLPESVDKQHPQEKALRKLSTPNLWEAPYMGFLPPNCLHCVFHFSDKFVAHKLVIYFCQEAESSSSSSSSGSSSTEEEIPITEKEKAAAKREGIAAAFYIEAARPDMILFGHRRAKTSNLCLNNSGCASAVR